MFIKNKKLLAVLLTAVMVVSIVLVGKFTVTKADTTGGGGSFSMSNFRLNNSTQNKVEYGSSTPISLGIQITNADKGRDQAESFQGKFYFYYYRQGEDKVNDSILLNPEGFSAAECTDELKAEYGITDESGIKNGRLVAFCKTVIDTTAYDINDILLFWVKYVPGEVDYYSDAETINNNIGSDKAISLLAPTTVELKLDNVDDIEYGNTITLDAEVTSPYTGNQIDPLSGTVTFVITGTNGTSYTYVRTTSKDTDGKCQLEVPDELAVDGYTVTATYDPSSDKVTESTASTTFNVTKKPITIYPYPVDQEIQKNAEIPEYFDGYAAKDKDDNEVSVQLQDVKFITEITDASVVGTTGKLYVSDAQKAVIEANNPNYSISYGEGTLKVVTTRVNEAPIIELIPPVSVPSKEVKVNFRVSDEYTPNNLLVVTVKDANNNSVDFTMDSSGNCSFVAKENTTYTITVSDEDTEVGKKESTKDVVIDNIDAIAPTSGINKNTELPTKDGVIVTLTPSDEANAGAKEGTSGIVSIRVTDSNGDRVTVTDNAFTADENGTYNIVITDKAGNIFTDSVTVDNIDKVEPTLAVAKDTEEPAKEVTITLTPDDEASEGAKEGISGIDSVKVTDSKGNEIPVNDNKFTVEENGEYTVVVKDKSGNEHTEKVTVDNIDRVEPTLAVAKDTEEAAKEVTITLTPDDEASEGAKEGISGIDSVKVTDSEGNEIPVNDNKFTVEENGEYTVVIKDKVGNEHTEKITVDNIDRVEPTLTVAKDTEEPAKEVTITLTPDDEASEGAKEGISGIDSVKVTDSKGNEIPVNDNKFTVDENGEYTVVIKDKSGNEHTEKVTVDNIDRVLPTLVVEKDTEEPAKEVTITLTPDDEASEGAKDGISGIDSVKVTDSKGNEIPVNDNKFTVDENGEYTVVIKDKSGNELEEKIIINNIITEEPTEPETPTEPEEPSTVPAEPEPEAPSTGDTTPITLYVFILIGTLFTLGACAVTMKKKEER